MVSMVGLANTTARRRVNLFNPGVYITLMISSETLIKAKTCYTYTRLIIERTVFINYKKKMGNFFGQALNYEGPTKFWCNVTMS